MKPKRKKRDREDEREPNIILFGLFSAPGHHLRAV
jgi:hypothetical protein